VQFGKAGHQGEADADPGAWVGASHPWWNGSNSAASSHPISCRRLVVRRLHQLRCTLVEGRNQGNVERKAARTTCPICVEVA
jgi:hypothetical protein